VNNRIVMAFAAVLIAMPGCVTSPPPEGGMTSMAYAVGDRANVTFDEVVVSLPLRGVSTPYQNLHVALRAFVNPIRTTHSNPWDAQGIVQRCEGRMAARVSEALSSQREQSLSDTARLRELARQSAQAVVDEAMKKWESGADYRIEIAISSFYWTDASVGRIGAQNRQWW
jgi:hypothetical protein